ncbi:G-type lectin S-receptor-like serine/threonine-protein kinase SD2-5 [Tanacetum coccineum]
MPIANSDRFTFGDDGNAKLQRNGSVVWSTNTAKTGVSAMELLDSGNLILSKNDDIKSGDSILYAEYKNPQPYWSMGRDWRRVINKSGGDTNSATIEGNSWRFYDESKVFLWQFVFAYGSDANDAWVAGLEDDGFIKFYNLESGSTGNLQIPDDSCSRLQACSSYFVCHNENNCLCPLGLAQVSCDPKIESFCNKSNDLVSLVSAGDNLSYFALGFVSPDSKTDLDGCKSSCLNNCTCLAMFFDNKAGSCYMFDQIGSFNNPKNGASIKSYIKVYEIQSDVSQGHKNKKQPTKVVIIVVVTVLVALFVILGLVIRGLRYYKKKYEPSEVLDERIK